MELVTLVITHTNKFRPNSRFDHQSVVDSVEFSGNFIEIPVVHLRSRGSSQRPICEMSRQHNPCAKAVRLKSGSVI